MVDDQASTAGPPDPCLICLNPEGRLCSSCHSVAYCSKDCQHSDWSSHKNICSQIIEKLERPEGHFKRAIMFKPNDDKPRLVWLEVQRTEGPDDEAKTRLSTACTIADFLACPKDAVIGLGFQRNVRRNRDLRHTLVVSFYDRKELNYCVREATDVRNHHDYRGTVIFSKKTGFTPSELDCGDIEATDYLDIIDFLISFGNPVYKDESYLLSSTRFESNFDMAADFRKLVLDDPSDKQEDAEELKTPSTPPTEDEKTVQCVRIACEGDLRGGSAKFKHVVLPLGDATAHSSANAPSSKAYHTSHISQLVGMPLLLRRVIREHGNNETDHVNPEATLLLHELHDTSSDSWGWPPPQWQAHYGIVGSIVAMRKDGEDLTIQQVRELCEFARMVATPLTDSALEGDVKPEDVRKHYLTREKIDDFVRMKRLGMQE